MWPTRSCRAWQVWQIPGWSGEGILLRDPSETHSEFAFIFCLCLLIQIFKLRFAFTLFVPALRHVIVTSNDNSLIARGRQKCLKCFQMVLDYVHTMLTMWPATRLSRLNWVSLHITYSSGLWKLNVSDISFGFLNKHYEINTRTVYFVFSIRTQGESHFSF